VGHYVGLVIGAAGLPPGLLAWVAAEALWRRERALEAEAARLWLQAGYAYVFVFAVVGLLIGLQTQADPVLVFSSWVGLPSIISVCGLFIFEERQRKLVDLFPSVRQLHEATERRRNAARALSGRLAGDLHRLVETQDDLRRRGAIASRAKQISALERNASVLRVLIQTAKELEERLVLQSRRVRLLDEPDGPSEAALAEARANHRELATAASKLDHDAAKAFAAAKRELDRLKWLH
jgi:hypothetical protein